MAFIEGGNEGSLNGTTPVDIVGTPAPSTRRPVRSTGFYNKDTAAVTITLIKRKASTDYEIGKETLQVGERWNPDDLQVLDATDEKITAVMSAAAATTNPTFTAAYADVT